MSKKVEKGEAASADAGAEKQGSKGLPLARIKTIMKSSPDAATISQEATVVVAKATVSLSLALMDCTGCVCSAQTSDQDFCWLRSPRPPCAAPAVVLVELRGYFGKTGIGPRIAHDVCVTSKKLFRQSSNASLQTVQNRGLVYVEAAKLRVSQFPVMTRLS